MLAAHKGSLEMVQWILDHTNSINHRDNHQCNCLFYALKSNVDNSDVVRALLEKGAKVNQENQDGVTPLMIAAEKGLIDSLKVLIDYQADVNSIKASTGDTVLHFAVRSKGSNAAECTKELLNTGSDISIANKNKENPLDEAKRNTNKKVYEIIKEYIKDNKQAAQKAEDELVKSEKEVLIAKNTSSTKKGGKVHKESNDKYQRPSSSTIQNTQYKTKINMNKSKRHITPVKDSEVQVKNDIELVNNDIDFKPENDNEVNVKAYKAINGMMDGNKALGFTNGFPVTSNSQNTDQEISVYITTIKRKDKTIANIIKKSDTLKILIEDKEKNIANLEKKLIEYKTKLNIKQDTTPKLVTKKPIYFYEESPFKHINSRENFYKILDDEIMKFYCSINYIKDSEKPIREMCINEFKKILMEINPNLKLNPYGSYATNLWIPFSGIDLVISDQTSLKLDQLILEKLRDMVKKEPWFISSNYIAVRNILKVECKIKNLSMTVFVSIQEPHHKNFEFANLINNYAKILPCFSQLGILLKYIFRITELNDPYMVFFL